jgi:hypothetical protein
LWQRKKKKTWKFNVLEDAKTFLTTETQRRKD